jgi:hypothetical protein
MQCCARLLLTRRRRRGRIEANAIARLGSALTIQIVANTRERLTPADDRSVTRAHDDLANECDVSRWEDELEPATTEEHREAHRTRRELRRRRPSASRLGAGSRPTDRAGTPPRHQRAAFSGLDQKRHRAPLVRIVDQALAHPEARPQDHHGAAT